MVGVYIYLGSVVICHTLNTIVIYAAKKEYENRGYVSVEKPKNIANNILIYTKFLGMSIVPLLNLAVTIFALIHSDEIAENIIKDMLEDGKLVKVEEPEEIIDDKGVVEDNVITYNVNNNLTNEQKVEFLKQELSRLTGKEYKEKRSKIKQKGGYGSGRR